MISNNRPAGWLSGDPRSACCIYDNPGGPVNNDAFLQHKTNGATSFG